MIEGLVSRDQKRVPLAAVEVEGEVLGGTARIRVRQKYVNREARPVEAVYVFPLPSDATLTAFSMECAGRRVEGVVQEREQAFRTYDDAVTAGHGAALLEQERPNVFTANVGNLLPNEETLVEIEYVQRVQVDEGMLRWMIPTLVAPRYIPGAPAMLDRTGHGVADPTRRVPDADRISPPIGDVDYRLRMSLVLWVGDDVEIECPSHAVSIARDQGKVTVSFAQREVQLDRDVVVTARGSGARPIAGMLSHKDGAVGHCALTVIPDLFEGAERRAPQSVVFVVDRSGSMGGSSIEEARAALRLCLRHLREGDRFNIVAFDDVAERFAPEPVAFTQKTLSQADAWIAGIDARGGTELLAPLVEAVRQMTDGVVVLLTDGQVGNETEILEAVLAVQKEVRVFSFGIGTNVSDALLRDLARRTGGGVELIHPGERIDEKVVAQFSRATAPRVTDVKLRFHGVEIGEIAPAEPPALVDGEPWTVFGTYEQPGIGRAEIRGVRDGEPFVLEVPFELEASAAHPAIPKLWATERIRDLEGSQVSGGRAESVKERIVKLAVEHGVSSKFTSFVVVEKRAGDRRASGLPETRVVSVQRPAGWAMFQQVGASVTPAGSLNSVAAMRSPGPGAPVGAPPPARGGLPRPADAMPEPEQDAFVAKAKKIPIDRDDEADEKSRVVQSLHFEALEERASPEESDGGALHLELLSRQLASGLWDDPAVPGDEDTRRLRATAYALVALLRDGVTTAHAAYGAQVRKAIEAMLPLLAQLAAAEPRLVELCIAVAYLASSGKRTRASVDAVVDQLGMRDKVGDEAALRSRLDQLAVSA